MCSEPGSGETVLGPAELQFLEEAQKRWAKEFYKAGGLTVPQAAAEAAGVSEQALEVVEGGESESPRLHGGVLGVGNRVSVGQARQELKKVRERKVREQQARQVRGKAGRGLEESTVGARKSRELVLPKPRERE